MSNQNRIAVVLGITGGIACGKSAAGRMLELMGFKVCDADAVAHDLMKKGTPVFVQVADLFGNSILSDDGEISRPALGSIVFNDPDRLRQLNQLVHPAVRDYLEHWIAERRRAEERAAILIPLLFESGMQDMDWDATLCIASSEEEVITRLSARGLTREESIKRISSQMPTAEKEKLAGYTVPNHGTPGELEEALRTTVAAIEEERRA